jgi:hypothetical protein
MMIVDNKYEIGQIVYLVSDEFQAPHIITALQINSYGNVFYLCVHEHDEYLAADFEISSEKGVGCSR